jgi:predicted DNA-binding transcriptional regulator AlpA
MNEDRLLKTKEVLSILNVSYSYFKKILQEGKLKPALEIGKNKRKRFLESEVNNYLKSLQNKYE